MEMEMEMEMEAFAVISDYGFNKNIIKSNTYYVS